MNNDYQEFLDTETSNVTDVSYDVGFHPAWDSLRLNLSEKKWYEGENGNVELWLTPDKARELAGALYIASRRLERQKASLESKDG